MNELLNPEMQLELERIVNKLAQSSAQIFDARGELEPAVFAVGVLADGASDVKLIEGASRFFGGEDGKDALGMLIENFLTAAPEHITPAAIIVAESWATFGVAARELEADGGYPSRSASRQEVIMVNLVLPGGQTFMHCVHIDSAKRKTIQGAPFKIEIAPGMEARSRFAVRPTQH